ncbi:MAG: hypothetical protein WC071_11480, partial [Victivallaceae bacterium]
TVVLKKGEASETDATTPDCRPEERRSVRDGRDYTGLPSGRKAKRPRRTRLHRTVVLKKGKASETDATTPDCRPEERRSVRDGRDYTGLSSGRKIVNIGVADSFA